MKKIEQEFDIVVVGGGIAGICAAIGAARSGVEVALVHDRALLGGNASGELKIHIAGADCSGSSIARFARESGIIDEIRIENLKRNPANSQDILSVILREFIWAEANIRLFMNTRAGNVRMNSPTAIESVDAEQLTTEKKFTFKAGLFIDCTGDAMIAAEAGAEYRIGRESREEFGESLAPEVADAKTLPSCVEFYLRDMGEPTPFIPPPWAYKYESEQDLPFRGITSDCWLFTDFCGGYWWLSAGGDKSTIKDDEDIYEELLKVLMGIFDLMKNGGDYGAENYAMHWISPIPGKRESRRCAGDYWLTQNDVLNGEIFPDAIGYGGWSIDIHPPEGVFSTEAPNYHIPLMRPYTIPLRCLYSRNISNLMFAGRNASYTHIGLGSPRVMATCGVVGQAAGVAAAFSVNNDMLPGSFSLENVKSIQQTLLRDGVYIPGVVDDNEYDLAVTAKISSSSEKKLIVPQQGTDKQNFEYSLFQLFPVTENSLDSIRILVEADAGTKFEASFFHAEDLWDFVSSEEIATVESVADKNGEQWVELKLKAVNLMQGFYWIKVACSDSEACWLAVNETIPGVIRGLFEPVKCILPELDLPYKTKSGSFIFELSPQSRPYAADNVANGVVRSEKWTNIWISEAIGGEPEWIQFSWDEVQSVSGINIAFDGQFDSNIIWPEPLGVFGCRTLSTIVKDYDIEAEIDGKWQTVEVVRGNYRPYRIHRFEKDVATDTLRVVIRQTNGIDEVRLYAVRVWGN